jgi:NADP-dependent 3-hydroxy acid dehydrogenase YdfG
MNEKQFTGKVAFVTGATSGIGHACAIAFATAGANVVCVGRKAEALKNVEQKIRELGTEALNDSGRICLANRKRSARSAGD